MKLTLKLSIILTTLMLAINSNADIEKIASEFNKGNLSKAISLSNHYNYKDIHKFLLTQKYIDNSSKASFEEITDFLNKNSNWPQSHLLITTAENLINSHSSRTKIVRWFDHHQAKTQNGFYHYFKAAEAIVKDKIKLDSIIRSTWINYRFSEKEGQLFLKKYKATLTQNDHIDKISELLWLGKTSEAKQLFYLVDKNYQQVFTSWIELDKSTKKAEVIFHKIKGSYKYHSGLLYSYLKLHTKTPPNNELTNLYLHIPKDEKHSKEWWKQRNYYARELFKEKQYQAAYKIVSSHNLKDQADLIDAEWFAGWIALRYLKAPKKALQHFEIIYSNAKSAISLSRASYWIGRSYKILNNKESANKWFAISANYGFTFYGQLSQYELGYKNLKLETNIISNNQDKKLYEANSVAKIAIFLSHTTRKELLNLYAKEAFFISKTSGEVKLIYNKISPQLDLHWKVELAKLAQQAGVLIIDSAFPTPYKKDKNINDKILTHAIIRQESVFDQYAISGANAHGLMQIIPPTGRNLAKSLKTNFNLKKLTSNAEYNIKLGSYYLKELMKEHDNSFILTAANYNAGPVVSKWKEIYGDPKKLPLYKAIDFVESIPYYETRNYVQRILENIQIYRYLLTGETKLRIKNDLLN